MQHEDKIRELDTRPATESPVGEDSKPQKASEEHSAGDTIWKNGLGRKDSKLHKRGDSQNEDSSPVVSTDIDDLTSGLGRVEIA